jgi:hypothetical protein
MNINFNVLIGSILTLEILLKIVDPVLIVDRDTEKPLKTSYKGVSISVSVSIISGVSF